MLVSIASITTVLICLNTFIASPPVAAAHRTHPVAAPADFNITSLCFHGNGCPPGSANYTLSNDKSAVTITFSKFCAKAGPGISFAKNRKNCQLSLGLQIPQGFAFTVPSIDYRGHFQLDDNVTAALQSSYDFQGQVQQATARVNLTGPIRGDFFAYRPNPDDSTPPRRWPPWPPGPRDCLRCKFTLNIASDIFVNNANNKFGRGYIATDSLNGIFRQVFNLQWEKI